MIKATDLKCESLINPIGIDVKKPRLSWTSEGAVKQTAYRIVAVSDNKTVWDSGKVATDIMSAQYPDALQSRGRIEWSVTLLDENGEEGETV